MLILAGDMPKSNFKQFVVANYIYVYKFCLEFFSADWNMKGLGMNPHSSYKPSSDLSMLMGSSCNTQGLVRSEEEPKLENFLGQGHSSSVQDQARLDHVYSININGEEDHSSCSSSINNTIGLSMIKTWLRNQPPPTQSPESVPKHNNGGGPQTLSLSMSTGSQGCSPPRLTHSNGETCDDINKVQEKTATGSIEEAPRKSIDTFGQRTSIYRGVTRLLGF